MEIEDIIRSKERELGREICGETDKNFSHLPVDEQPVCDKEPNHFGSDSKHRSFPPDPRRSTEAHEWSS